MRKYLLVSVASFGFGIVASANAQLIVDATIDAANVVGLDAFIASSTAVSDHEARIAALEASSGTGSLADLTDVMITSPTAGDVLVFDGTNWSNNDYTEAGIATEADLAAAEGNIAANTAALASKVGISQEAGNVSGFTLWSGCTSDVPPAGSRDVGTSYLHSDQSPPCP